MQVAAPPLTISTKGCSPCWWLWASVSLKMRFCDALQKALGITAEMADRVDSRQVTIIPMSSLETIETSQQASCKMAHSLVSPQASDIPPPPPSTHSPKGPEVCFLVTAGETGHVPGSSPEDQNFHEAKLPGTWKCTLVSHCRVQTARASVDCTPAGYRVHLLYPMCA